MSEAEGMTYMVNSCESRGCESDPQSCTVFLNNMIKNSTKQRFVDRCTPGGARDVLAVNLAIECNWSSEPYKAPSELDDDFKTLMSQGQGDNINFSTLKVTSQKEYDSEVQALTDFHIGNFNYHPKATYCSATISCPDISQKTKSLAAEEGITLGDTLNETISCFGYRTLKGDDGRDIFHCATPETEAGLKPHGYTKEALRAYCINDYFLAVKPALATLQATPVGVSPSSGEPPSSE